MNLDPSVQVNWWLVVVAEVKDKTDGKCGWCGKVLYFRSEFSIDHIIPRSKGGVDRLSNLMLACNECNWKRGDKTTGIWETPMFLKNRPEEKTKKDS